MDQGQEKTMFSSYKRVSSSLNLVHLLLSTQTFQVYCIFLFPPNNGFNRCTCTSKWTHLNLHEPAARDLGIFTAKLFKNIYVYDFVKCYPEVIVVIVSFCPESSKVSGVIGTAAGHFLHCLEASIDT